MLYSFAVVTRAMGVLPIVGRSDKQGELMMLATRRRFLRMIADS
jgi:hypothetical protein